MVLYRWIEWPQRLGKASSGIILDGASGVAVVTPFASVLSILLMNDAGCVIVQMTRMAVHVTDPLRLSTNKTLKR
jgi:hypothetical protein